jgi:hypothetical protein
VGLVCNFLIRPVADRYYMTDAELEAERRIAHEAASRAAGDPNSTATAATDGEPTSPALVALCWLAVGLPLAWGVYTTISKAAILFR